MELQRILSGGTIGQREVVGGGLNSSLLALKMGVVSRSWKRQGHKFSPGVSGRGCSCANT